MNKPLPSLRHIVLNQVINKKRGILKYFIIGTAEPTMLSAFELVKHQCRRILHGMLHEVFEAYWGNAGEIKLLIPVY